MPTPLEPFVETKEEKMTENESLGILKKEQSANILETASVDSQKNKHQSSPRRKFVNRSNANQNGNRNNRNNSLNKRSTSDNNNNNNNSKQSNGFKNQNSSNQQQQKTTHDFQKPPDPQMDPKKHSNHQNKFRTITKTAPVANYYEDRSPPSVSPTVETQKPKYGMPQPKQEVDNMSRKYSMDFLHQVGYKLTGVAGIPPAQHSPKTPKHLDDANLIALKMALGDNSGYYTHFYAGSMYGNQMIMHQQQQQLNQFARYQQQQQPPMQRLHRVYQRGHQDAFQRVYQPPRYHEQEGAATLPCHCSPQAPQFQRSYSNTYANATYQNGNKHDRRDYRENSKKGRNGYQYHNDRGYKREFNNRNNPLGKSDSFTEEDLNKGKNFNRASSDDVAFRSLSPTPPNSSVSSSPGAHEKKIEKDNTPFSTSAESSSEQIEDSVSTASASSSVPSSASNLKVSLSAPILMEPEEPTKNVNLWIDNNFGGSKTVRNGLSVSAENLNMVFRDPPITIIKRPPSAHEVVMRNSLLMQRSWSNLSYDPQQPFDYYLSRSEESEMRIPPAQLKCGSQWDRLSEEMWEKFIMSQQSRLTYRKKMILWRDLYESVKNFPMFSHKAFPKWGLFLVGSTISSFGADSSDIDMCLVSKGSYHSNSPTDQRVEAIVTLNELQNYLIASKSSFQNFSLINAKVPILRFRDASNKIEIDLNFNNCVGVRNTQLLFSYSQLDWRLRPLALIVKLWAQFHNINDARNSTISSYSLVLMVIHFLQYAVKPAVLPCLHQMCPEKFKVLHDITTIDMVEKCEIEWKSENQQPLGELFLRFLDYYSNFDYGYNAISIRTGGVLPIEDCRNARSVKNDPNHWLTLCIEEPFDLTNTARSAYDGEIFIRIKDVFFQSWLRLKENRQLSSVFTDPIFTQQPQPYMNQINHQIKYMSMPSGSGLLTMAPLSDVRS